MSDPNALRIALVAGEASGDQLGATLITSLRRRYPDAEFAGIGGPQMMAAGLQAWHQADELAVMGLIEVLRHLPRLLLLRWRLRRRLLKWRPQVFIGIDAPDFNLGLERKLKQAGIATAHYVSPSIWAWRENRAERMGESADRVLCLFPMEPPIYARYGVDARFVGHPLAAHFRTLPNRDGARAALGIDPQAKVLAILPGSRQGEINRLAPAFIAAAHRCQQSHPNLTLIAPMANAAARQTFEAQLAAMPDAPTIRILDGQSHLLMIAADVVLVASGTAALEVMLAATPMVVGYRIAALSHWIVRKLGLLKSQSVSLPNILAGAALVPELLQDDCHAEALASALLPLLEDPAAAQIHAARFAALAETLQGNGAELAADAIADLIRVRDER